MVVWRSLETTRAREKMLSTVDFGCENTLQTCRDQMFKPVSDGYRCSAIAEFFAAYNSKLLESSNYRTRRQAIKFLGEILLDGSNSVVMTRHVSSRDKATGVFEEIEHEEENNVEEREK
ncbi:hypothetical protein YC2023_024875 [Brassica napus]